jgi:hypothetical protein
MKRKTNTTPHDMQSVYFEMTGELVSKLRDDAIAAAIDAQVKKDKWKIAALMFAEKKLREEFGEWVDKEGTMEFSDGDQVVKLLLAKVPTWTETEPQVLYVTKLKSGKFSKSSLSVDASYVLSFFRSA